jgi:UDP-GlcNAc:undecaprenyl-phosphate GlcNAc-1-phosphate transferase
VQKASTGVALLIPILALGLPIIDTSLTMLRRFINNRGIFSADRGHLHHVLLDSGISHRRVVIGLYAICCVLCSLALVVVLRKNKEIGYYLVVLSIIGSVFWGVSVKRQLRQVMTKVVKIGTEAEPQGDK